MRSLLIFALMLLPATAEAQRMASPFLPAQHWVHAAFRELEIRRAIRTDAFDVATRTVSVLHAIETFDRVAANEKLRANVRSRAERYAALLREEYGEREKTSNGYAVRSGAEFDHHDGRVAAGDGYYPEDRTGAQPRAGLNAPAARLGVDARTGKFAFTAEGTAGEHVRITELQAVARVWDSQFWAGRRANAYGVGTESITINSDVSFNGAGWALDRPMWFPSVIPGKGRMNLDGYIARLDRVGVVDNPWFLAARASYSPHPNLTGGITRGAVFGGDDNAPITFTNFVRMLVGMYSGDASNFENQVISWDMRYSIPRIPLVIYYEWGMDDGSGAWLDVPARLSGATLGLDVAGAPIDITFERTRFAPSCCGNPVWYRHHRFLGSWAIDGVTIGHPLGGEGIEHAGIVKFASPGSTVRGRVRGFTRERGAENVFSPERGGKSNGGELELAVRATPRIELELDASTEHGELGWTETRIFVGGRVRLMQGP